MALTAEDILKAMQALQPRGENYSPGAAGLGERYGDVVMGLGQGINELAPELVKPITDPIELVSGLGSEFYRGLTGEPPKPTSTPIAPRGAVGGGPAAPEAGGGGPMHVPPGGSILGHGKSIFDTTPSKPEPSGKEPGAISAYTTADGKVFFTNHEPPKGASKLDYEVALKGVGGTPGGGGFMQPQEQPEVLTQKKLQQTLLDKMLREASMTPEERQAQELDFMKKRLAAESEAKNQATIDEYTKMAELLGGTDVPDTTPEFEGKKREVFQFLKANHAKIPALAKATDDQLWAEAYNRAKDFYKEQKQNAIREALSYKNRLAMGVSAPFSNQP